ncbi:uridylate-specific endoribonuclease D-like [Glandiceps talaboti]
MKVLTLLVLSMLFVESVLTQSSCQSRCGVDYNPSYPCQCNDVCDNYGNCCSDYDTYCKGIFESCENRCGETYDNSNACHCDDGCSSHGNCCSDYDIQCDDSDSDSGHSCQNRCGEKYDSTNECHCNDVCGNYGNCCDDYSTECGSPGDDLSTLASLMYNGDVNAASDGDITLDIQGQITDTSKYTDKSPTNLFSYVNESLFKLSSYDALIKLLNNYIRLTGTSESESSVEKAEIENFMDEVMNSYVMQQAHTYLVGKGLASSDEKTFRAAVESMWFDLYSRSVSQDSSGFEHVFVGEVKNGAVSGFHNWVNLYLEESSGKLNYHGYTKQEETGVLGMQFEWDGYYKAITSVFMGRSPEFEMAIFTVCFLQYPDARCNFNIDGNPVSIQTWTMYNDYVGSAYVI